MPLNGKRIADTRSGLGAPAVALTSGKSIDVQVTGLAGGVPAGASAVIVNLIAVNSTTAQGYLVPYMTGAARPINSFNYAGGSPTVATSMQAQVALSPAGKISVYNYGTTTHLVIDVQGYFTAVDQGGSTFTPSGGRLYDTRITGNTALAANETRTIGVDGVAGVPAIGSGISAAVLTLTALKTTAGGGNATAWADGAARPNITSINFEPNAPVSNTITVPLGANGKIRLNNVASGATNYVIDVQGWYTLPIETEEAIDAFVDGVESSTEPGADETLTQFETLSPAEQQRLTLVLVSPDALEELLQAETRMDETTVSETFGEEVTYSTTSEEVVEPDPDATEEVEAPGDDAEPAFAARGKNYPANSRVTGSWTATQKIFGITILKLKVWATFTTRAHGIPKKILSSGSGATNYNFAMSIDETDHEPYMWRELVIAQTTWHGRVLYKGANLRLDKLQTTRWYYGGLHDGSIKNI